MRGFTLIELVVVIAIIAVLGTLGISMIDRYDAVTKQTQYCVVLDVLETGVTNYITRYHKVPTVAELQEYMEGGELLVNPYTNRNIFLDVGSTTTSGWNIDQYGHIQTAIQCEVNGE